MKRYYCILFEANVPDPESFGATLASAHVDAGFEIERDDHGVYQIRNPRIWGNKAVEVGATRVRGALFTYDESAKVAVRK